MLENDDYNGDQFFLLADELEEYQSIMDNWEDEPPHTDFSYNIFTLEQALNIIYELGNTCSTLGVSAEKAAKNIENFITLYSKIYNKE